MDYEQKCLICGQAAEVKSSSGNFGINNCCDKKRCGIVEFDISAEPYLEGKEGSKFKACLYYYFTHYKLGNGKPYRITIEKCNRDDYNNLTVKEIMNLYPDNISDRLDMILLNLAEMHDYIGAEIHIGDDKESYKHLLFVNKDQGAINERNTILDMMIKLNLIAKAGASVNYIIDYKGWERIDELNKINAKHDQGFIAMMFNNDLVETKIAIKNAINKAGYLPRIMNNQHHNGQVVPEMLYQIRMSDFLVADLTGNRGGVYFEAGYALGLKKEVIFTVDETLQKKEESIPKKNRKNSPHFDVAQYHQIRYNSPKDLEEQLFKRIISTVGDRSKKV